MLTRGVARVVLCALLLSLASDLPLAAQKLHNEARDKLAQQIKSDFEQLTSPEGNIFEQAIKNADAINDADIQQWRDRERTLIDSVATTMPFMTWEELQNFILSARGQILEVSKDPDRQTTVVLSDVSAQLDRVTKQKAKLEEQLKPFQEKDENGRDKDPIPTVQQIEGVIKKALQDGTQLDGNLTALKTKIESLPADFKALKDLAASLQPQGLNRLMLETQLLLLQNEEARLQLRQTHAKERQGKLNDFDKHIQAYAGTDTGPQAPKLTCKDIKADIASSGTALAGRLGSFWKVLGEFCDDAYNPQQNIISCLQNLAENAQGRVSSENHQFCLLNKDQVSQAKSGEDACSKIDRGKASGTASRCVDPEQKLINVLIKLHRVLDLLTVRYDLLVEETNLSQDELIFQIRMMQLNAQQNEVLVHAGITGLATYEAGGIKPEDIANIIHTAQTLATAAIAARVK